MNRTLRPGLAEEGIALFDGEADGAVGLTLSETARELTGSRIMANTVAVGAVFAVLGYDVELLCAHLERVFAKKGRGVVEQNALCARRGAELAAASPSRVSRLCGVRFG